MHSFNGKLRAVSRQLQQLSADLLGSLSHPFYPEGTLETIFTSPANISPLEVINKISHAMVVSGKNVPIGVVVRMPPYIQL